jgi:parvulin-like peptidyl-prolyl isomerase
LRFADADVELARVDGVAITACDVALFSLTALREGSAPLSAREALARAVREATFAREAEARPGLVDQASSDRIDRTLADAVIRDAARRVYVAPTRAEIERYFAAHRADFDREARVHVRAIAVLHESSARALIRQLQAGAPFEHVAAEHSVLDGARRDEGDLGLVTIEGNDIVPRAVAQRAFALTEYGAIDPVPVRVEVRVQERVGRRRRVRTRVRWYVVQRLERIEPEVATLESAARRIAFLLGTSSWREALLRQRAEVLDRARAVDSVSIDEHALRWVSIRRAPAAATAARTGRTRTHRIAAPGRR